LRRSGDEFDVVVAFEERVFEQIIEGARLARRASRKLHDPSRVTRRNQ
jgi:hypothetical protein